MRQYTKRSTWEPIREAARAAGRQFYDGHACTKGHTSRYVTTRMCVQCQVDKAASLPIEICSGCNKEQKIRNKALHLCANCYTKADDERLATARQNQRWAYLLRRYLLTPEKYDFMLQKQGGVCAICKRAKNSNPRKKHFCVDHSHITGKNRGLLCDRCNKLLGFLEKSPEIWEPLKAYLIAGGFDCQ
jgi:hypothetical protein